MKERPRLPRIGPCRDPLHLWFLEFECNGQVWRRYYADRDEARRALRELRTWPNGPPAWLENLLRRSP